MRFLFVNSRHGIYTTCIVDLLGRALRLGQTCPVVVIAKTSGALQSWHQLDICGIQSL